MRSNISQNCSTHVTRFGAIIFALDVVIGLVWWSTDSSLLPIWAAIYCNYSLKDSIMIILLISPFLGKWDVEHIQIVDARVGSWVRRQVLTETTCHRADLFLEVFRLLGAKIVSIILPDAAERCIKVDMNSEISNMSLHKYHQRII